MKRFALVVGLALVVLCLPEMAWAELGQPVPGALGLPESASPMKAKMADMHDNLLMPIVTGITLFVFAVMAFILFRFNAKRNPVPSKNAHNPMLEVVWTIIPVLILLVISVPSMKILYYADKVPDADMTLKVIGNQWNWTYEYPDNGDINFIANMVPDEDLKPGEPRLLKTDAPVVLPIETDIRLIITASDVIHSFAIPSLGIKLDAVPGRLNETWVRIDKEGTFYGQCSEICGAGHGFMPIEIKGVSKKEFNRWVAKKGGKKLAFKKKDN